MKTYIYEVSLDCLKLFTCKQEPKKQTKIGYLQLHYLKYFTHHSHQETSSDKSQSSHHFCAKFSVSTVKTLKGPPKGLTATCTYIYLHHSILYNSITHYSTL